MGLLVGSGPLKPVLKRGKTVITPDSRLVFTSFVSVTSWCEANLLRENCIAGNRLVSSVTG